jgi:signal transduction histidine kinase
MKKLVVRVALAALVAFTASAVRAEERATTKDAERMVHKATEYVRKVGKEKAFAVFSDPKGAFTYRDLYIYVLSQDGVILAHGTLPQLVGKNNMKAQDPDGKFFTREAITLAKEKGSGWFQYKFENPTTHKIETKVAFVELVDGVVVGCGAFKP